MTDKNFDGEITNYELENLFLDLGLRRISGKKSSINFSGYMIYGLLEEGSSIDITYYTLGDNRNYLLVRTDNPIAESVLEKYFD